MDDLSQKRQLLATLDEAVRIINWVRAAVVNDDVGGAHNTLFDCACTLLACTDTLKGMVR